MSSEKITESEIFSNRLKKLRGARNKVAFSRFLETSPQNYGRYENGRVPGSVTLSNIANRCGVSVDWLLGRTDDHTTFKPIATPDYAIPQSTPVPVREDACRYPADCNLPAQIAELRARLESQSAQMNQLTGEVRSVLRLLGGALAKEIDIHNSNTKSG